MAQTRERRPRAVRTRTQRDPTGSAMTTPRPAATARTDHQPRRPGQNRGPRRPGSHCATIGRGSQASAAIGREPRHVTGERRRQRRCFSFRPRPRLSAGFDAADDAGATTLRMDFIKSFLTAVAAAAAASSVPRHSAAAAAGAYLHGLRNGH